MSNSSEKQNEKEAIKMRLLQFRDRESDIKSLLDRLDVMEMQMKSISSPSLSDMPKSGSPFHDRMAYMIAVKVDLEAVIQKEQEEQYHIRNDIEAILKKLHKADERAVIRARYLDCTFYHENKLSDWSDVAYTLFGNRNDYADKEDSYVRRVHKIHNSALVNLTKHIEEFPIIGS